MYMATLSNEPTPNKVSFSGPSLESVPFRGVISVNRRSSYDHSDP